MTPAVCRGGGNSNQRTRLKVELTSEMKIKRVCSHICTKKNVNIFVWFVRWLIGDIEDCLIMLSHLSKTNLSIDNSFSRILTGWFQLPKKENCGIFHGFK